jgi:hypothetical protein
MCQEAVEITRDTCIILEAFANILVERWQYASLEVKRSDKNYTDWPRGTWRSSGRSGMGSQELPQSLILGTYHDLANTTLLRL